MPRVAKPKISPRKTPRQARSQSTVQTILEAATRVLSRESLAGFNTNRVAEVAGISVGSLYQYFPNKEALVTALILAEHEALNERFGNLALQLKGCDASTTLKAVIELGLTQQFSNPLLAAALDHEEARLPLKQLLTQSHQDLLHCFEKMLRPHFPHLTMIEVEDCMNIGKALIEAEAQTLSVPSSQLAQRVYRALSGYLAPTS